VRSVRNSPSHPPATSRGPSAGDGPAVTWDSSMNAGAQQIRNLLTDLGDRPEGGSHQFKRAGTDVFTALLKPVQ
jgi:hypothetical protein